MSGKTDVVKGRIKGSRRGTRPATTGFVPKERPIK